MAGKSNYIRGAGGKFAGSTGGRGGLPGAHSGGGKIAGGARGVVARVRLRKALSRLREARAGGSSKSLLARKLRHVALHRREVLRVEKRGPSKLAALRSAGVKLSKGERRDIRQDRVFFAREKVRGIIARARADRLASKTAARSGTAQAGIHAKSRREYARALLSARRSLRNRKRELARLG